MQTFNNESMILEMFREVNTKEILPLGNFLKCKWIHCALTGVLNRKEWIDSSGKNDPPPDFYDNKHKLMMDVMRIDDHAYIDEKGRIQNKTLQHEGELIKKINQPDRDDIKLFVVGDTKLPTNEDHNFERYYKNFERVFKEHAKKLDLYQANHPGFKTIFFICDESCAYVETFNIEDKNKERYEGCIIPSSKPHLFCLDKKFVKIIKESKVDYVIWYAPWKLLRHLKNSKIEILTLPKCAIFDVKNITDKKLIEYDHKLMMSSEM